ncbi:MAG: type II toxin-antitoxin system RelE/ParE family toxin [Caulobacteraceae bacterium]|nr:type II toxin-antitoxin system RelE/ParE family toxin [Caulobacteraceae bacterium]
MPRQIRLSETAKADLLAARQWLTQSGAGGRAKARLRRITEAIKDLRRHPCRWPVGDHPGVRERPVEGYRLMYEVAPDTGNDRSAGDVAVLRMFGPFQDRTQL